MAKPKPPFVFTVEGAGIFPIDMLRYDQCWPKSEDDSGLMIAFNNDYRLKRQITLTSNLRPPTEGRWKSFSWNVIAVRGS